MEKNKVPIRQCQEDFTSKKKCCNILLLQQEVGYFLNMKLKNTKRTSVPSKVQKLRNMRKIWVIFLQ